MEYKPWFVFLPLPSYKANHSRIIFITVSGITGFCAIDGVALAKAITEQARHRFADMSHLSFITASARNRGGEVW